MAEISNRIVPGAPPPTAASKSQKKKRKSVKVKDSGETDSPVVVPDTATVSVSEKVPGLSDVKEGVVAPGLVTTTSVSASDVPHSVLEEEGYKPSPVVDLVHKRLKAIHKKIARISTYASTPQDKLNDDQKRTLKTLPSLEAVQKELEEVKKAIEVHESEQVNELLTKRLEAERAEKQRLNDAVAAAQHQHAARTSDLLSYLRLNQLRSSGQAVAIELEESEHDIIVATCNLLLGDETEHKQSVLSGFLTGQGDYDGVPYTRLHDIVHIYLNPVQAPTPVPEEPPEEVQPLEASDITEPGSVPPGGASSISGSFHFMQASELEGGPFENAEWVERADAAVQEDVPDPTANGDVAASTENLPVSTSGPIDWAEDEGDNLPSIAGLHAKFGTSGTATPAEETTPPVSQPKEHSVVPPNGSGTQPSLDDDDGFTQAGRGGRGRRMHGGFRDVRGGGYRGFRGGFRGDRGSRGGFRGGDRGGFRGRSDGDWKGEGRGRGRGRGGAPNEPRGAAPA